jgi:hypothetical protein
MDKREFIPLSIECVIKFRCHAPIISLTLDRACDVKSNTPETSMEETLS